MHLHGQVQELVDSKDLARAHHLRHRLLRNVLVIWQKELGVKKLEVLVKGPGPGEIQRLELFILKGS